MERTWKKRAIAAMIAAGAWTGGGLLSQTTAWGLESSESGVTNSYFESNQESPVYQRTGFFSALSDTCASVGEATSSGCDSCCSWCNIGDPWKLSKEEGFDFGGWVDFGWQNAPDGAFTDAVEADKFNLNQLYVYNLKAADGSEGWDWGYRFDALFGVDGNDAQAFGNNPGVWDFQNGFNHGPYEIALPQAYLEMAHCDTSIKIGHFYTPIGYEVVTTPDNFFYSKQLTFYNSEPFTHTGVLATHKISDNLSAVAGWALGWDTGFDQFAGSSMGLYGAIWKWNEETTFTYMGGAGNFGVRGDGGINSLILSRQWSEKWQTVHQLDMLSTNNATNFIVNGVSRNSTGFINYVFYSINDCLKLGGRQELYKADGVSYNTFTAGLNFRTHANWMIRPEIRYNNSPGDPNPLFNKAIWGLDVLAKF